MKRKNLLGVVLLTCGAVSLVFGWPWGSLVGAILALSGVLALRLAPSHATPPPQPESTPQPSRQHTEDDPEQLTALIKEMESRGETVSEELIIRAQRALQSGLEDWFQKYEALISNSSNKVVDLAAFAQEIRAQYGWPPQGPVLGHEAASEETDFVLTRIEHFGGKVPLREAIFMQAMLEDGPEGRYLKERQRKGYPSLFDNKPRIEWSVEPGFYEKQLQIRHNNVFFPPQKQCVSRHDVFIARRMDAEERSQFLEQWKQCLENAMNSADIAPASEVANHLHAMYALLENAASIGAENTEPAKQIRSAYETVLAGMYRALKDNPEATKVLQTAEEARWSGSTFALNPRIKQIMRMGDVADVIPAMLSEDVETIRLITSTLNASNLADNKVILLKIASESKAAREVLLQRPEKLEAFGVSIGDLGTVSVA